MPMVRHVVGEVIQPYAGGGDYGRCKRCQRTGLKVVEIPAQQPIKPKGWSKIPTE
jgi:hypothetical protein